MKSADRFLQLRALERKTLVLTCVTIEEACVYFCHLLCFFCSILRTQAWPHFMYLIPSLERRVTSPRPLCLSQYFSHSCCLWWTRIMPKSYFLLMTSTRSVAHCKPPHPPDQHFTINNRDTDICFHFLTVSTLIGTTQYTNVQFNPVTFFLLPRTTCKNCIHLLFFHRCLLFRLQRMYYSSSRRWPHPYSFILLTPAREDFLATGYER